MENNLNNDDLFIVPVLSLYGSVLCRIVRNGLTELLGAKKSLLSVNL